MRQEIKVNTLISGVQIAFRGLFIRVLAYHLQSLNICQNLGFSIFWLSIPRSRARLTIRLTRQSALGIQGKWGLRRPKKVKKITNEVKMKDDHHYIGWSVRQDEFVKKRFNKSRKLEYNNGSSMN